MKKNFYISAFVFLGVLLQFIIHGLVEFLYIKLLLNDFEKYSSGLSWDNWYLIHYILSIILLVAGIWFGFSQGKYWWKKIYGQGYKT